MSLEACQAVIFDLAGTLVEFSPRKYLAVVDLLGRLAGSDGKTFAEQFWISIHEETPGRGQDWEGAIRATWSVLGAAPSVANEQQGFAEYMKFQREFLAKPKQGALEVLRQVRDAGFKTGLITNTAPPVPELWPGSSLATLVDVAVFSCMEGIEKPSPGIYRLCAARLGVDPSQCLFVGDGSGNELTGAVQAGMRAVMCCVPDEDQELPEFFNRQAWDGPKVDDFGELLAHLSKSEPS